MPPLIIGIGNILLRDEGVGVRAVEAMQRMDLVGVELLDGGTSGADLLDEIANRGKVIFVDAADANAQPGTIFRFTENDLMQREEGSISLHEFGLVETLLAARHLGCSPREVVIFGVQPADVRTGLDLSPEVVAVLPSLVEQVLIEAGPDSGPNGFRCASSLIRDRLPGESP